MGQQSQAAERYRRELYRQSKMVLGANEANVESNNKSPIDSNGAICKVKMYVKGATYEVTTCSWSKPFKGLKHS